MYIYISLRGLVYKCIDIGYLNDKILSLVIHAGMKVLQKKKIRRDKGSDIAENQHNPHIGGVFLQ